MRNTLLPLSQDHQAMFKLIKKITQRKNPLLGRKPKERTLSEEW